MIVRKYPAILCTSLNDEIVHCPPSGRELKEGDILSIDLGVGYKGWNLDTATTVAVGEISGNAKRLIEVTKKCLDIGIKETRIGKTLGDLGYAIQKFAKTLTGSNFNTLLNDSSALSNSHVDQ